MLKEKILYKDGLPVNCTIVEIEDYPIHFHEDPEIVFVLEGSIILKNGYYTYVLKKDDIYIMNDREIHSYYKTEEPNKVILIQLDQSYFLKYYEILKNSFFITDTKNKEDESLERLRDILARLALEYMTAKPGKENNVTETAHCLIDCLITDFHHYAMEDGKFVNESKSKGNKILTDRVNRITEYMYENYGRRLTLSEIAERENLSIYYLSHVIKEATGLSFQELLNFIRVEESEILLLGSNKKIGEISLECGFSAVRYYIKYFIKWFGMHPADYRKKYTGYVRSRETPARMKRIPEEQIENILKEYIGDIFDVLIGNKIGVNTVEVHIDDINEGLDMDRLTDVFEAEQIKPAATGFELLKSLHEDLFYSGSNTIITRSDNKFSIFVYNFGDSFNNRMNLFEIQQYVERHDFRHEILIKISGLSGKFRIARLKFCKDCLLSAYRNRIGEEYSLDLRERMINNWTTTPETNVTYQFVSDSLNIHSYLNGFSTELILIDPVL